MSDTQSSPTRDRGSNVHRRLRNESSVSDTVHSDNGKAVPIPALALLQQTAYDIIILLHDKYNGDIKSFEEDYRERRKQSPDDIRYRLLEMGLYLIRGGYISRITRNNQE